MITTSVRGTIVTNEHGTIQCRGLVDEDNKCSHTIEYTTHNITVCIIQMSVQHKHVTTFSYAYYCLEYVATIFTSFNSLLPGYKLLPIYTERSGKLE